MLLAACVSCQMLQCRLTLPRLKPAVSVQTNTKATTSLEEEELLYYNRKIVLWFEMAIHTSTLRCFSDGQMEV